MRTFISFVVLSSVSIAQAPLAFKASVRLVNISFTVRDARGTLVTDLNKDDVEVLDDGTTQTIAFFARSQDLPLALGLLVDASGSQQPFNKRHQHDLRQFLKSVLRPQDQAFLLCFGNHMRLAQDFTSSPADLAGSMSTCGSGRAPEIGPPEIRLLGTAFYDALYYGATLKLASIDHARRSLVIFSDGEDNSSAHHMLEAIEAAQTENAVVFGIRYTEIKHGRWTARNKYGMRVMERVARETGGTDFDAEKTDVKEAFRLIGEELRSSYELAYHSTHSAGDGTFHKVVVRAKRPGLTVRTKTGYFSQ